MRNPELTKEKILKQSGKLFNTKGYKATSLSDITSATGLTKGAIYKHFLNKEKLEEEAFDEMSKLVLGELREAIIREKTAPAKLKAIVRFYETYITHPVIQGGCPLLNTAVEADDANPRLKEKAIRFLNMLEGSLIRILKNGMKHSQLKPGLDTSRFASLMIALLEGAIMMSRLRSNTDDMKHAAACLYEMIEQIES